MRDAAIKGGDGERNTHKVKQQQYRLGQRRKRSNPNEKTRRPGRMPSEWNEPDDGSGIRVKQQSEEKLVFWNLSRIVIN